MAVTKLDKAKVALVTTQPFFASILLKRGIIEDKTIPTAAVDQRGQIYVNPDFAESLTVQQLVFLLAHEVGHVIGQHATRRGTRQAKRWNTAGDAWINDMLREANVGDFITGGVDMPGSKDDTVDAIYNRLPEDNGDGPGKGPGGIGDDLIERGTPLTQDEADKIDAETRVEVAQAAQAAKMQGKLPAAIQKVIADLINSRTPWYDILLRHMTSMVRGDISWARPNRRFEQYLPSVGSVPKMGEVAVLVDVSGSISQRELAHYNGHLKAIIEQCNPERVHVLYTDTRVCRHDEFGPDEEFGLEFYSGGGTDLETAFSYLEGKGITPEVFVALTDGYTSFDPSNEPAYPVLWCISTDVVAPYGETIRFNMED